jgi:hypothetical protein
MKKNTLTRILKHLGAAIVIVGLNASIPFVHSDDDTKVKVKDGKVKMKGKDARELLKPEVNATFIDGYTIPSEYQTHFTEVPAVEGANIVVRYYGGRAYYVNSNDWKIQRVVDLDTSIEVSSDAAVYVEGYVIPDANRTRFIEVPNPDSGVSIRYYNNTAYYMDPSYRIIRTVPLMP